MVELGLSFKMSGLDLDLKIWQSAHLCQNSFSLTQSFWSLKRFAAGSNHTPKISL